MQLGLMGLKPQFRRPMLQALQASLLEGFSCGLSTDRPLFALLQLVHEVNHLAALAVRRSSAMARPYDWYQKRWHMARLRGAPGA